MRLESLTLAAVSALRDDYLARGDWRSVALCDRVIGGPIDLPSYPALDGLPHPERERLIRMTWTEAALEICDALNDDEARRAKETP